MKRIHTLSTITLLLVGFTVYGQDYKVNTRESSLKWIAKKVTGSHYGGVKLADGVFSIKNSRIVSGRFTIDMTTISVDDIKNPEWNKKLLDHLNSDDFFSVQKHKTAVLEVTDSKPFVNGEAQVSGSLTIKGKTHPISFRVRMAGGRFSTTATVDRTLYDIRYGSGKFFDNLGDNMIYDEFTLEVLVVTEN